MKDSLRKTTTPDNLPHQTEDLAESKPSTADRSQSETGTRGLIPENKAGQGRQELQQEVLAGSQPATSGTIDLSDYAPTGSFVLSREGTIVGLNLSGTKMLRQDSKILKGSLFGSFVSDDTKPVFNKFLREVYDDQVKATCEITLLSGQKTPTYVYLTGSLRNNKELCLIMAINITERRQNEERLQQERNLYLDIVNNQPAGIYRIRVFQPEKWWEKDWNSSKNPPYCMELASDRFCEILGITRKEFEATPAIIADLIHPDDLPEFSIKNEEANNLIIPFRWEGRLVIREKTSWVHLESIPRPLPTGEILWTGILYDITEQKKVEKALIESKNNYRELVDNSPDAICIYSEGEIVLVNNAYIRLMAATGAEDLIGIQIIETVHPHYRSLARERMHKAMTRLDIQPLVEEQLIRLDGTVVDIEVKAVPITFQDKQSVQVIVRDITARKKAEKERAEIQENFKDLFYNAPIGYHEIDTEGRIVRMNQTELAMLGYTEEELIGKFIWEINVNESKSQKAVKDKLQGRNFPTESFNRDFRRKDGSTFPVLLKDKLLRDNEGRITGIRTTIQDISENEKAENELKKSREEFKDLFNNAPVGYHELDSEGRIAQMNQTELDMYGYTLKEVIGKYIWEIAHNRSQTYQETKNKLKGIDIPLSSFEATLVNKKSGMRYTVLILDRILRDPDGQITGIRTTIQDITERKQAELKLRLSEERFRSIFENSTVGKSMTSVGGKLLANLAFSEIVGYSQDELSHLHWTDFTHKDDLEFNKKEIELILKGKKTYSHWEKRYIHKNGSIVWVDISTFLLRDNEGNPLYFITEVNDITERKLAEKAIKESEALYRNLVFRIPDGVYTSTPDGRFTDVNPAMVRILGYDSKEELMQIDIKSQLYLDPTERENMVLQQQHGETGIYRLKKKDGSVIWVEDQGWYNTDSDGKIVKHEGILSDITERKLAQDALQKSEFLLRNTLVKSTGLIDTNSEDIDYERISNTILEISGAKYVGFNIFEENLKDFTTVAVSGIRENLLKASSYLGFEIVNKKWKYDPVRDERTKGKPITRFESISDLSGFAIPPRITTLIESVFNLGETFIVKITKNTKTIGDFTIIYPRGETMQNNELVLLFANQVALFIDRERTNKALRINEEKYRFLFANNPQPMYIYDLETFAFLEVNLAATEHYGYSKEEFLSMTIKDIRPPEDIPALLIDAQDERSSYKPAGVWRHIKKNGEMIFVEITTVSVISSGKPVRHVLVQDITERKRAEEALRESEEKYRTMIENSNDLIWTLDKNGNFTFLNEIAQKTTGLHRDEWIGKSFMPIVMNEDLPLLTDIFTKTMKGQYCNYELRFKKSDEETLTILVNTSPIYVSGKIEGVVSFGQDITDGKKSLELLQESEEKFRSIAEQTSDLIAIADENGFIRFASTASKSTFLYNPEEMYGHHLADFLVEESIEKAITAFDRCIQKHENISNLELKMKRKDGTLFYGEINGSSFKYGNNYGTLVVLRDMTERKKAQAELEEKMDELLRFHRLTVDRELNMIELKKEVNDLLQKAGEAKKYKIVK